jgi:NADH:ubiquinone oxidoreductase subunit 6 (subunit J)
MSLVTFMFYLFGFLAVLSALMLAIVRHVFYGALLLIVCLLALAGIYVLAFAEFVAITQILIYAGGILVIIIFGIMLTTRSERPLLVGHTNILAGIVVASTSFGALAFLLNNESFHFADASSENFTLSHVNNIGVSLMTSYMLPFEVSGILLLMALVGAAVIGSTIKRKA